MKVLTNNPLVFHQCIRHSPNMVEYHAISLREMMRLVRDRIHLGHKLLTHPLSGSVKPSETPFKSIGISDMPGEKLCVDSLMLIEQAIAVCDHLVPRFPHPSPDMLKDYQLVDLTLILSALEGSDTWRHQTPEALERHQYMNETAPGAPAGNALRS